MTEKIILQIIKDNKIISDKKYKSLLALSKDYPNIAYHQWREIYMNNQKDKPRKLQKVNLYLSSQFKVIDNPEFYNKFIQNSVESPVIAAECAVPDPHQSNTLEEIQV
jgi:hypothetical protein